MRVVMKYMLVLVFVAQILNGCSGLSSTSTTTPYANILQNQPQPGTAGLKGRVLNLDTIPWRNTEIRLAEIYRNPDMQQKEGVFVLNESQSPGTISDEQGFFQFQNVPARDYVLVVGDVNGKYKVILDETDYTRVFTLEADKTLDVGDIKVDINQP